MGLSQKPRQIFDKNLQNVGNLREAFYLLHFIPSAYLLQLPHHPIGHRLSCAISRRFAHVSRARKSSSIMVNLLKIAGPLNRSGWPGWRIHTLSDDLVQRQSRQSPLTQRDPIQKIYLDKARPGGPELGSMTSCPLEKDAVYRFLDTINSKTTQKGENDGFL